MTIGAALLNAQMQSCNLLSAAPKSISHGREANISSYDARSRRHDRGHSGRDAELARYWCYEKNFRKDHLDAALLITVLPGPYCSPTIVPAPGDRLDVIDRDLALAAPAYVDVTFRLVFGIPTGVELLAIPVDAGSSWSGYNTCQLIMMCRPCNSSKDGEKFKPQSGPNCRREDDPP
jgi:hypothetical protein